MLALANAALFLAGGLLHAGVEIAPVAEPPLGSAVALELAAVGLLGAASLGAVVNAAWARAWMRFANLFALVAVAAVAMLLGLDGERSTGLVKGMQLLRVIFAALSLLMLYHAGHGRSASR